MPVGATVVGATGPVEVEDTDEEADPTDGGRYSVWEVAGILPLALTLPSGTGYTLRTYNGEDDDPVFLGSDLTVDVFRTADGLVAYCRSGDEHDLAEMVTWADIAEADELPVEPADFPLRIRGYDMATHLARIDADPGGFPWLAADEL